MSLCSPVAVFFGMNADPAKIQDGATRLSRLRVAGEGNAGQRYGLESNPDPRG